MDWKLSYIIDEEDFKFLHAKGSPKNATTAGNGNGKETKSEGASTVWIRDKCKRLLNLTIIACL